MRTDFVLFGPAHLAILAAIPCLSAVLARLARGGGRGIRICLGVLLGLNELIWYGYRLRTEGVRLPEGLPLQLCDLALWLTVAALITLKPWACEAA